MQRQDLPRVLAAQGVSNFGTLLSRLAIPFLAALQLQATPLQRAALLADGLRCAVLAVLAVLAALALAAWAGVVTVPLLVLAAAVSGLCTVAFELARSAWTAQRVVNADLTRRLKRRQKQLKRLVLSPAQRSSPST